MPKAKEKEINTMSDADLVKELTEKRETLRGMRFNVAGSKVKNVREQRATKKEVARILTELNKRAAEKK
jgi:ribosomal protein L29